MKSYPFARLYLRVLVVLALVCVIVSGFYAVIMTKELLSISAKISTAKSEPIIIDTAAISDQMVSAAVTVRLGGAPIIDVPVANNVPYSHAAILAGNAVTDFQKLLLSYKAVIPSLKEAFLTTFNQKVDVLQNAARAKIAEIQPANSAAPTYRLVGGHPVKLFEPDNLDSRESEMLARFELFLREKVQRYSPAAAALAAGRDAAQNISAAKLIYDSDLNSKPTLLADSTARTTGNEGSKSQLELLNEFTSYLDQIRLRSREILMSSWIVEKSIQEAELLVGARILAIKQLNEMWLDGLARRVTDIMKFLIPAIILLVIRDFLAAAIDTAQNTAAMRESLSAADVQVAD